MTDEEIRRLLSRMRKIVPARTHWIFACASEEGWAKMRIAAGLLGLGPIKDEEVEIGHLPFISSKTGRQDQLSVLAVEKKAVPQLVIEALLIVMGFLKRPNLSETDLFILSAGEANQAFIYECLASIDCGSFRTFDSATIQNN